MSALSASRSTTLPLPSSPHWVPMITLPGTAEKYGVRATGTHRRLEDLVLCMESAASRDTARAMSDGNSEAVRDSVAAFNRGDLDAGLEIYDRYGVVRFDPKWPENRPRFGKEEVRSYF